MAGYSSTPLAQKLGIVSGSQVYAVGAPANYRELLDPVPEGVTFVSRYSRAVDLVHLFFTDSAALAKALRNYRDKVDPTGVIWVSWPKKTAKVPTDITDVTIRELALPLGFVDIKVCAIDATWSGLKLVIRKKLR
jgi:hypothetical protein